MSGYVVTVDFRLKPGTMDRFRKLLDRNAIDSCRLEPGCRRFDVMLPEDAPDRVFLYEIYDHRQAFGAHLQTEHFKLFNDASAELLISKDVKFLSLVCEGSEQGSD